MKGIHSLIRKLVDTTAEEEEQGRDVADILKSRCFNDTNLVRQTIMNAVCDPRFKMYASAVGFWKDEARKSLEMLADQLKAQQPLTQEAADCMLEDFMTAWLRMTFREVKISGTRMHNYLAAQTVDDERKIQNALDFLEEAEIDEEDNEDRPNVEAKNLERTNSPTEESDSTGKRPGKYKQHYKNKGADNEQINTLTTTNTNATKGYRPLNSKSIQHVEETYLAQIPDTLMELARRIGRMGDDAHYKEGPFLSASKSDICGITTGNDISAVLPSELALLADPRTQDVFYHNYVSHRLQLFASASQAKSPNRHHDGPVIVCVDVSTSMAGKPMRVAMALAVAVAIVAWRKERDVIIVKYSDYYEYHDLGHDRSRLEELRQFFMTANSGGNNENALFQWLFEHYKPDHNDYGSADILCISDFGWTSLDSKTKELIEEQKKDGMMFYGLNINKGNKPYDMSNARNTPRLNGTSYFSSIKYEYTKEIEYEPAMSICDSIWEYSKGVCYEVTDKVKKHQKANMAK